LHGNTAPGIFLLASEKLSVASRQCLVIEDATHGVTVSKAAGMLCLGFKGTPHNRNDLSQADAVVTSFLQLEFDKQHAILQTKVQV